MQLSYLIIGLVFFLGGCIFFLRSVKANKSLKALTSEKENLDSIIEQANDAMLVIDIVDGRIHRANPSAAEMLGYSVEELQKKSLFDLHPPELLDKSSRLVADTWEKKGLIYDDVPFRHKNGELIPVECSSKVAPFAGRPAIVIYARNITERLRLQAEINAQRKEIDEKNKDIHDSIEYSRRIQRSLLPEREHLKNFTPDAFIFFQPREIVSGDFFWFINYQLSIEVVSESGVVYEKGSRVLVVAAADCTGHGVPGAFMSMIGSSLLDQTTRNINIRSPAAALDYVNAGLKKHLNKNQQELPLRDGMDIALCSINVDGKFLEYACANNPAYLVRNGELIVLAAEKQALTASPDYVSKPFQNNFQQLQSGDCLYLFTDGFADQFGGEKGRKFMYKQFKELLVANASLDMNKQKDLLESTFNNWKGKLEQVDDVLVIGIRIP